MKRYSIVLILVLVIAFAVGCGRTPAPENAEQAQPTAATTSSQNSDALPFSETKAAESAGTKSRSIFSSDSKSSPLVPESVSVPAGTTISIRLQQSVSSATAHAGDRFDAVLDEPLAVNGRTVAPRGAAVVGRVVQAKSSGRIHNPGYLRLTLASVEINGKQIPVQASSIFVKGASHKKRNLALIGGGAGAGALIGALAGGGKGALIGSAIGAGAGTTGAYVTGKKEVGFGPERRLSFRLLQPASV